jgi:hypothetical protein
MAATGKQPMLPGHTAQYLHEPEAGHGRPRVVQYFERARFEYFPENAGTPYEVQLGLLGEAILMRSGVDWQSQPKAEGAPLT